MFVKGVTRKMSKANYVHKEQCVKPFDKQGFPHKMSKANYVNFDIYFYFLFFPVILIAGSVIMYGEIIL